MHKWQQQKQQLKEMTMISIFKEHVVYMGRAFKYPHMDLHASQKCFPLLINIGCFESHHQTIAPPAELVTSKYHYYEVMILQRYRATTHSWQCGRRNIGWWVMFLMYSRMVAALLGSWRKAWTSQAW